MKRMGVGVMGGAKLWDSCKSATATVYCRADSAYLCISCDTNIHAANKLASRHPRVWVCEHAPASVTCKADAAHLCSTCDLDIHSANPLACRHQRLPLAYFYHDHDHDHDYDHDHDHDHNHDKSSAAAAINKLFGDEYYSDADEAEATVASWLLPNNKDGEADDRPNTNSKSIDYLFSGGAHDGDYMNPYLDLDFSADPKPDPSSDGVVPDQDQDQDQKHNHNHNHLNPHRSLYTLPPASYHFEAAFNNKPYSLPYNPTTQPSLSHSVSSSSLEFGVVPDASAVADGASTGSEKMKVIGMDREARVLRYIEKRKNRKFEKTVRYASRKAYAETRPRIKGRFAKRTDVDPAGAAASSVNCDSLFTSDPGYGVVPSF